jgi:hypothetical protein
MERQIKKTKEEGYFFNEKYEKQGRVHNSAEKDGVEARVS